MKEIMNIYVEKCTKKVTEVDDVCAGMTPILIPTVLGKNTILMRLCDKMAGKYFTNGKDCKYGKKCWLNIEIKYDKNKKKTTSFNN